MSAPSNSLSVNLEAENSVLGAMISGLLEPDEVLDALEQADFYGQEARKVFGICSKLYREGIGIDIVSVSERYSDANYLTRLTESVLPGNHQAHIQAVKDASIKRQLQQTSQKIFNLTSDRSLSTKQILDQSQQLLHSIHENSSSNEAVAIGSLCSAVQDEMMARMPNEGRIHGIPTG